MGGRRHRTRRLCRQPGSSRTTTTIDRRTPIVCHRNGFSHSSKLALVETVLAADYRVVLYHVHVRLPGMSVARVAARTVVGGHAVPENKIRERYERNPSLIRQAAARASVTLVFDNSKRGHPPQWLLSLEHGVVTARADMPIPDWATRLYL